MKEWWDIKDRGIMGSAPEEIKEVTILGRTVAWKKDGLEMWADDGHRRKLMAAMELTEDSNPVEHPIGDGESGPGGDEVVDNPTEFRGSAARLNYLALDRSDVQFWDEVHLQRNVEPDGGRMAAD